MRCVKFLLAPVLWLISISALAVVEVVHFDDESLRPRYQQLIEELRCPKCQNQNLADSNSPISVDMRREVKRILEEGGSDAQVKEYLVSRYSEFVLYRPQVNQSTLFLWLFPALLLLIGVLVIVHMSRRQRTATVSEHGEVAIDKQRLQQLLDEEESP